MSDYINALNSSVQTSTGTSLYDSDAGSVMGKEDFLMLLVEQLKNQDPTNPEDATEFTSQLTEFSSLEQLENLNTSMESLVASNENSDKISTLGTIGKDVAYVGSEVTYSGSEIQLGYQLGSNASEVTISLKQGGTTLATIDGTELDAGNHFVTWDGLTDDGNIAPIGDYDIVISAKDASENNVAVTSLIRSEVTGVDLGGNNGGTLLTTEGEISFNSIIGVFESGASGSSSTTSTANEEDDSDEESFSEIVDDTNEIIKDTTETYDAATESLT